jgi:hypothetical protein
VGGDLRAHPTSSHLGLRIIVPMQALVSLSANILVSLPIYFKLRTLHYLSIVV